MANDNCVKVMCEVHFDAYTLEKKFMLQCCLYNVMPIELIKIIDDYCFDVPRMMTGMMPAMWLY
jgi:hypothetical protein